MSSNEIEYNPYQHNIESLAHVSLYLDYFTQASTTSSRGLFFNTASSSLTPGDPSALPWVLGKWGFVHICPNMTKKQQRAENCSLPPPNSTHASDPNNPQYFLSLLLTCHIPRKDKLVGFYLRESLKHTHTQTTKQIYIIAVFKSNLHLHWKENHKNKIFFMDASCVHPAFLHTNVWGYK